MAEAADVIKEGAAAVPVVSQNFAVVVAILALLGVALLVYRDEQRADAQIKVLGEMSQHISDLDGDFRTSGVRVGETKAKRQAAINAVAVAPP